MIQSLNKIVYTNYCVVTRCYSRQVRNRRDKNSSAGTEKKMPRGVHYSTIYDPLENEEHRGAIWVKNVEPKDPSEGRWEQYVGYGRSSWEKDLFRNSMNVDHPIWTAEDYDEKKENQVYPLKKFPCEEKRVSFFHEEMAKCAGEEKTTTMKIDQEDRENRVSRNFADILCDYAEKCGPNEKKVFFKEGGRGTKWTSKGELMEKIGLRVEEVKELMEDPDFILNLSDVSVRNYPRRIFESFYERYSEWVDSEDSERFKLNAGAKVFVPGEQWMPLLSRSSPKKICGVYEVEPLPPQGKPEKKRPPSKVSSEAQLCWEMKNDSDEKLREIEKKLELLIGLNGPIVEAKPI